MVGGDWLRVVAYSMQSQTEQAVPSPTQAASSASASTPATLVPPPPGLDLETPPWSPASASTLGVASAGGSTLGPAEAAVMLADSDIETYRTAYSSSMARKWLASTRKRAALQLQEVVDLTADPTFNWRQFICSSPCAIEIIGLGVVLFEGRFLNTLEPNRSQLRLPLPYGETRFDCVAVRADGTAYRLHPGSKQDAIPIVGRLQDWAITASNVDETPSEPTSGGTPTPTMASMMSSRPWRPTGWCSTCTARTSSWVARTPISGST